MSEYCVSIFKWCDRFVGFFNIETDDPDNDILKELEQLETEWHEARIHLVTDNKGNAKFYKHIRKTDLKESAKC